jgi:hypothetical protein
MDFNIKMAEHHQKDWKGKVRIIAISLDTDMSKAAKMLRKKDKWKLFEQYFVGKSNVLEEWGIKKVPHIVLVDKNGKIAYRGNPGARADVYRDIQALLRGEKLVDCYPPREEMARNLDGFKDIDS